MLFLYRLLVKLLQAIHCALFPTKKFSNLLLTPLNRFQHSVVCLSISLSNQFRFIHSLRTFSRERFLKCFIHSNEQDSSRCCCLSISLSNQFRFIHSLRTFSRERFLKCFIHSNEQDSSKCCLSISLSNRFRFIPSLRTFSCQRFFKSLVNTTEQVSLQCCFPINFIVELVSVHSLMRCAHFPAKHLAFGFVESTWQASLQCCFPVSLSPFTATNLR